MDVILSTAFGVKAETQTVENDPITELAKKATSPKPIVGLCKDSLLFLVFPFNSPNTLIYLSLSKCNAFFIRQFEKKKKKTSYFSSQYNLRSEVLHVVSCMHVEAPLGRNAFFSP